MSQILALVPAAGSGARFGGELPKQYITLRGQPMICHCLAVLSAHPKIAKVAIVIDDEDPYWDALIAGRISPKCRVSRLGGLSRAVSVQNGLKELDSMVQDDDWILVHDAARPCLTASLLDRLFGELLEDDVGGLLAIPVRDTLKHADDHGRVDRTESREGLWQAQTPQMFRYGLLMRALSEADLAHVTDEASAVETLGLKPKLVNGSSRNIKVTYPEDVALAERLLESAAP